MSKDVEYECEINASGYCDEQYICGCEGCRFYLPVTSDEEGGEE